ncbi:MAG: hypothetical protein Q9221_003549 [Calogaya cf. arnoldii]
MQRVEPHLFVVYVGPHEHYKGIACIYRSQKEAIEACKKTFYRLKSWDENRGSDSDEDLIGDDNCYVEISKRPSTSPAPATIQTLTVQRCVETSVAVQEYLTSNGREPLDTLWVLYHVADQKSWRIYIDGQDAAGYLCTEEPSIMDKLAIKSVTFKDVVESEE